VSGLVDTVANVGLMLVHLGWQALLVASLLSLVLRVVRNRCARLRYGLACGAYAGVVLLMCITALHLFSQQQPTAAPLGFTPVPEWVHLNPAAPPAGDGIPQMDAIRGELARAKEAMAASVRLPHAIEPLVMGSRGVAAVAGEVMAHVAPWLGVAWLLAVAMGVVRLVWYGRESRRLVDTASRPASVQLRSRFRTIAGSFGLERRVALRESEAVTGPCVVGVWRTTVLVPVGLDATLNRTMLDSLLTHELAHVRRHDLVAALIQSVMDAVFWVNPAALWISARLRETREEACDEAVVAAAIDPTTYARALFHLVDQQTSSPRLVTSSTHGRLTERIERLLGVQRVRRPRVLERPWFSTLAATIALLYGLLVTASASNASPSVWSPTPTTPDATWVWITARGGIQLDLTSGITAIEPGGWLRIDERRVNGVRTWMATPGPHGEITLVHAIDGVDQRLDGDAVGQLIETLAIVARRTTASLERLGEPKQGWSHTHVGSTDADLVSIVHVGVSDADPFRRLMDAALVRVSSQSVHDHGGGTAAAGVPVAHAVQYALTLAHQLLAHDILTKPDLLHYVNDIELAVSDRDD